MAGPRFSHATHGLHEDIFSSGDVKVVVDHREGVVVVVYGDVELSLTCIGDLIDPKDGYWNDPENDMSGTYGPAYKNVESGEFMVGTWARGGDFHRIHHGTVESARA